MNFWQNLSKPIVGLSPMDGVTDAPMRFITAKYGKPDVIFTEFVSVEALARVANGKIKKPEKILRDLKYDEIERPIVAQLFGGNPEAFLVAAKMMVKLGFDGVDINMGCPAKKVTKRGEGAGLINNPVLAGKIIEAVKEGVGGKIPVSVKTRIGYDKADLNWWKFLATQDLAAVTVHGRTFKQMYEGKADWEMIAEAAKIIKSKRTIFLGNGDMDSRQEAEIRSQKFGVDGVLIGRGAMGKPEIFDRNFQFSIFNFQERMKIMIEHCRKFEELFPEDKFFVMRKHLAWYAKGFENASELRQKLVQANNADEVEEIIDSMSN